MIKLEHVACQLNSKTCDLHEKLPLLLSRCNFRPVGPKPRRTVHDRARQTWRDPERPARGRRGGSWPRTKSRMRAAAHCRTAAAAWVAGTSGSKIPPLFAVKMRTSPRLARQAIDLMAGFSCDRIRICNRGNNRQVRSQSWRSWVGCAFDTERATATLYSVRKITGQEASVMKAIESKQQRADRNN